MVWKMNLVYAPHGMLASTPPIEQEHILFIGCWISEGAISIENNSRCLVLSYWLGKWFYGMEVVLANRGDEPAYFSMWKMHNLHSLSPVTRIDIPSN